METKVKLDFYNIESFGYYKKNEIEPKFGYCSDILNQLKIWLNGKNISQTNTFTNSDQESAVLQVYCPELLNNTAKSSFLLHLWNEIPNDGNTVQSLNGDKPVGSVNVESANVPDGGIPGFPTYFWFLPEQRLFACVRINESLQIGRGDMEKYIIGFMKKYSKYVRLIKSEDNPETKHILFAENEDANPRYLYPKFNSRLSKHKTKIQELRQKCSKIMKIIKKETISLNDTQKRKRFNLFKSFLSLAPSPKSEKEVKYRYELNTTLTTKELNNIINSYDYRNYKKEDIAFCFDSNKKIWLSQTVCKIEDKLDIEFNKQTPSLQSLFDALEQQRDSYLSLIR